MSSYADKALPDPAPYPPEWSTEQRVSVYWYALSLGYGDSPNGRGEYMVVRSTRHWRELGAQLGTNTGPRRSSSPPPAAEPPLLLARSFDQPLHELD
jgi:hypothetical protein